MTTLNNQFGLAGQSDDDYDFFIGKGKRKKKKAKRAMKRLARKAKRQSPPAAAPRAIRPAAPASLPGRPLARPVVRPVPVARPAATPVPSPVVPPPAQAAASVPEVYQDVPLTNEAEEILEGDAQEQMEQEGEYEDSFLGLGKKAREKRKLKSAQKLANIERTRAEAATIQSVAAPASAQSVAATGTGAASLNEAQTSVVDDKPEKGKSNTTMILVIVGGVIVAGIGLLLMLKKPEPPPTAI